MSERLGTFCLCLWTLGILGMGTARGVFHLEPGSLGFDLGAGVWFVGGATYCFLGLLEHIGSRGR